VNIKRKSKRWIWSSAIAVLVVAALVWGFRVQPVIVETVAAARGPLRVTVEEEGKTRVRDRYVVSAPVTGFARRLNWKTGDPIKSGDTVAQLEPLRSQSLDPRTREQSEARVRVAEAALKVAEQRVRTLDEQMRAAQVDSVYWKKELERATGLRKSGDIAQDRYDKTVFEARRADAALSTAEQSSATARVEVETARAELQAARALLVNPTVIANAGNSGEIAMVRAPVSGRVLKVIRESEGVVNLGDPLLEIANARALEVEVEVLSADAVRIGSGTRVLLNRWGGDRPLEARLRRVEPTGFTKVSALGVEEQRVRVIADITSPEEQWQRLGDGYRVEASFVVWEDDSVLQIPASAIFRSGEHWAVFVVENAAARRRPVEVGRRTGLVVQILSGLKDGELVITHPDDTVSDGTAVEVKGK
jgi:HlyD family secretion protein